MRPNSTFDFIRVTGKTLFIYLFTFSHFHWLNVLWSSGSGKPGVVCLCVCVSVCLCVCVSVCVSVTSLLAKLLGRFQPNLPKLVPQWSSCVRFIFSSLAYLMTSRRPFCMRARGHCHGHSFDPIFLKFIIWVAIVMARFRIAFQLSTSSTSGQNDGWKKTLKTQVK